MPVLVKKYIESLQPKEKDYVAWDAALKGFGCKVTPKGRKVYIYCYRNLAKRQIKLILGKHGLLTTDMARKKVSEIISKINDGIDPREEKKKIIADEKQSMLFKDFWKIFEEKYIKVSQKPGTIYRNKSIIKQYILPYFGEKPLSEITKKDIMNFSDTLAHVRGTMRKCLNLISCAYNKAIQWEQLPKGSNPCDGVEKPVDRKMERFLNDAELSRVEDILLNSQQHNGSFAYASAAIALLLYTGCRKSEITELKWKDVFLKEKYLYFGDSKTGTKTVPLNAKAIKILENIPKQGDNPYVCCGKRPNAPIKSIGDTWQALRKKAGIPDVRLHDLRHSFASFALKNGVDLYTVSKLLGHKNIATTTRYAHLELGALKEATNKVFQ